MLSKKMITLIEAQKLGFVASVDEAGNPNVSPKGTFVVLDHNYIMFSEIRSPNTIKNIKHNPEVEINFVDPFTRKGVRVRGNTRIIEKQDDEYAELFPYFAQWGELSHSIKRIVIIKVTKARELSSPIYDLGANEDELIKTWSEKFAKLHPEKR